MARAFNFFCISKVSVCCDDELRATLRLIVITSLLHGQLLHLSTGPIANILEQDFSKLISTGKLETPSLYIAGYVPTKRKSTLGHRQCGVRDPNEKGNVAQCLSHV